MSEPVDRGQRSSRPEQVDALGEDSRGRDHDPLHATSPATMGAEDARAREASAERGSPFWLDRLAPYVAISAGGLFGANARFVVGNLFAGIGSTAFPWSTLLVNVSGCFLIGLFLTVATERLSVRPTTRLFVATGCLGSYTTFSIFSYETVMLVQYGAAVVAAVYVTASLSLGYLAVIAGAMVSRKLYRPIRASSLRSRRKVP